MRPGTTAPPPGPLAPCPPPYLHISVLCQALVARDEQLHEAGAGQGGRKVAGQEEGRACSHHLHKRGRGRSGRKPSLQPPPAHRRAGQVRKKDVGCRVR